MPSLYTVTHASLAQFFMSRFLGNRKPTTIYEMEIGLKATSVNESCTLKEWPLDWEPSFMARVHPHCSPVVYNNHGAAVVFFLMKVVLYLKL